MFYDTTLISIEHTEREFTDLTVRFNKRETIIDLKRLHLYYSERRETVLNTERNQYMIQIFIDFFKRLSNDPIFCILAVIEGFRTLMWLLTQLLRINIWLVVVISKNKDKLITFFTYVKDLVSSLIYEKTFSYTLL